MSFAPLIAKLPRPMLDELLERLKNSYHQSQTFTDHANWLNLKGYKISRSQVHRFCQDLRKIKFESPDGADILTIYLDRVEQANSIL